MSVAGEGGPLENIAPNEEEDELLKLVGEAAITGEETAMKKRDKMKIINKLLLIIKNMPTIFQKLEN